MTQSNYFLFDPLTAFDPTKQFRALVLGHLAQTHGLLDITSLGYALRHEKDSEFRDWLPQADPDVRARIEPLLGRTRQPQLAAPVLVSKGGNRRVMAESEELALAFAQREPLFEEFNALATCGLLVLAWERVGGPDRKKISRKSSTPMADAWEFFYHCRNAAAHEGKFTFKNGEPRFDPVRWNGLEITAKSEGQPLLSPPHPNGLLGPGDPILLLWDIEQTLP